MQREEQTVSSGEVHKLLRRDKPRRRSTRPRNKDVSYKDRNINEKDRNGWDRLSRVEKLGWSARNANTALRKHNGNVDAAIGWLQENRPLVNASERVPLARPNVSFEGKGDAGTVAGTQVSTLAAGSMRGLMAGEPIKVYSADQRTNLSLASQAGSVANPDTDLEEDSSEENDALPVRRKLFV